MKAMLRALAGLTAAMMLFLTLGGIARMEEAQSVAISIPIVKKITGRTPDTAEEFTFILAAVDGAPMPESSEARITGAGTGAFEPITYLEPGDYEYTIREAAGSAAGYTYDSTVYSVTIQVLSDDDGRLSAAAYIYAGDPANKKDFALFTNRYRNNADIPKTGYDENPGAAVCLALGALAGVTALSIARQRRKRQGGIGQ